jgi:hypothetical protein
MKFNVLAVTPLLAGLALVACDSTDNEAAVNTAPVISATELSSSHIARGTSADLTVIASDAEGDTLTYAFSLGTCEGSLSLEEGAPQSSNVVTFNASNTSFGSCKLEVTVADGHGHTATQQVALEVDAVSALAVGVSAAQDPSSVVGVSTDGAPGFGSGSIRAVGTPKAELDFAPESLFGHSVTLGDIARMSYWTKKGTTHDVAVNDWYLTIYTAKFAGQTGGWYGARIGAEPYLAANIDEKAGDWNLWSTDGQTNQLRYFESTYNYFGSSTDPAWSDFVTGSSLTGTHSSDPMPYATQEVLMFSLQTASSAPTFDGQVDGVRIELKDGAVAELDMQP